MNTLPQEAPTENPEPNQLAQKSIWSWIILVIVSIVVTVLIIFIHGKLKSVRVKQAVAPATQSSSEQASGISQTAVVFLAYDINSGTSSQPTIQLVELPTGKILYQRALSVPDEIAPTKLDLMGANDPVQFDPKTGDVYVMTKGTEDYDDSCVNKDGTCFDRIYKIDPNTGKNQIIYQTDNWATNWLLDPYERQLLIFVDNSPTSTVARFMNMDNLSVKDVPYVNTYDTSSSTMANQVVTSDIELGADTRYAYTGGVFDYPAGKQFTEFVFDLRSKTYSQNQLTYYPVTGFDSTGVNFSPDGKMFSYSGSPFLETGTSFGTLHTDSIYNNSEGTYLGWAGQDHWIMYENGTQITYFEPISGTIKTIPAYLNPIDDGVVDSGYGEAILSHGYFSLRALFFGSGTAVDLGDLADDLGVKLFPESAIGFPLDKNQPVINTAASTTDWQTYTDASKGFSFKYPSDWQIFSTSTDDVQLISPDQIKFLSQNPNYTGNKFTMEVKEYDNLSKVPEIGTLFPTSSSTVTTLPEFYTFVSELGSQTPGYTLEVGGTDNNGKIQVYDFAKLKPYKPNSTTMDFVDNFHLIQINGKVYEISISGTEVIQNAILTSFVSVTR